MLNLKRKLIIVAIAAALPTLAVAQSRGLEPYTAVNPQDSGYHAVVSENPYQGKTLPPATASSERMYMTVNPEDSGYHMAVTDNPYQGKPADSRDRLTSKFRPVVNPEDSGYLGGWQD
ncbi:MAG: hypothetical protein HY661_10395 [Betaproteobacteria bacterium]|nr:hypothetical protein [Betaproteobacteria bacterium]